MRETDISYAPSRGAQETEGKGGSEESLLSDCQLCVSATAGTGLESVLLTGEAADHFPVLLAV